MIIDLHMHTTKAGPHSNLTPEAAVVEAKKVGLNGICVTEHDQMWTRQEIQRFREEQGFIVLRGMEVATDLGHIVVFGLDGYISGIRKAKELRKVVDAAGGVAIAVHPFRRIATPQNRFGPNGQQISNWPTVEEAMKLPVIEFVHHLEVANGASSQRENDFTVEVAARLGLKGTGGSDAHSVHGIGCFVTVFEKEIKDEADLIAELLAGRFHAGGGLIQGNLVALNCE